MLCERGVVLFFPLQVSLCCSIRSTLHAPGTTENRVNKVDLLTYRVSVCTLICLKEKKKEEEEEDGG